MTLYKRTRKYARKAARKAGTAAKRRYFRGKGYRKPKIMAMARDISAIQRMLNTEKKKIVSVQKNSIQFAQSVGSDKTTTTTDEALYDQRDNVLRSGAFVNTNLIPITRGSGQGEVAGDKMKLTSYHLDARVAFYKGDGSGLRNPGKVTIYLVAIKRGIFPLITNSNGATLGINREEALLDKFLIPSPFDNTYDSNSKRNFEFMKEFTVLQKKDVYLTLDENNDSFGQPMKDISCGGSLAHHVRLDAGGTDIHTNQLALIAVANQGTTRAAATNPHFVLEYEMTSYYVDN